MALAYTTKTNPDGTVTTTKTNNDGTKSTSTSSKTNNQYDYIKGSYGTTSSANESTYRKSSGSSSKQKVVEKEESKDDYNEGYKAALAEHNTMAQKLAEAQAKQRISELEKTYNSALSTIGQAETQTQQSAQTNRNNASVQAQLAQRNLARYLAENGLQNSGTNAQAQINNTGALQNTLGSITTDEQNALNNYLSQRTLAKNNLASDTTAAQANADATALSNQLSYLAQMQTLQQQYQNQANLYGLQNDYSVQNMQTQRDWANEDYANNISTNYSVYIDPSTGQQLLIPNSQLAQLNQANYQYNNNLAFDQYKYNNLSASDSASLANSQNQFNTSLGFDQYKFNNLSAAQRAQLEQSTLPLETSGFNLGEEEAYQANTNYTGSSNNTKTQQSALNAILNAFVRK